jgi:hypothetical protein
MRAASSQGKKMIQSWEQKLHSSGGNIKLVRISYLSSEIIRDVEDEGVILCPVEVLGDLLI